MRRGSTHFHQTMFHRIINQFDENACCHVALGAGFPELYPGALDMNMEQRAEVGINNSMIHVDFMVGTRDLSIVGIDAKGKEIQIFKDGTWAI